MGKNKINSLVAPEKSNPKLASFSSADKVAEPIYREIKAEVMVDKPGSDTTFLTKGAGRYYLDVSAVSDSWSIKIEEEQ